MWNGSEAVKLADKLRGRLRVEIRAALPETVLNACAEHGVRLRNVERRDACTLRADVCEEDWDHIRGLAPSLQAEAKPLTEKGGSRDRKLLRRRAVLLLSLLFLSAALLWSKLHIWEIDVQGCEKLTCGQVLRALEESGVSTGTYWPAVSVDAVRSRMLLRLPTLAWMTVNVSGSRALVHVVERAEKPEIYSERGAADVVASRQGILRDIRVLNGHPLVRRGDAVAEGEILVTGSLDSLSHPTRCIRAEARVLADTWYEWIAVEPEGRKKGDGVERVSGCVALRLGKKRINLLPGSRKELDGYDKIVHEYTMGVEGLFVFPVSLVHEEYQRGGSDAFRAPSADERLKKTLAEQIEGDVLQVRTTTVCRDGCSYTTLRAHCVENIAQTAEAASQ